MQTAAVQKPYGFDVPPAALRGPAPLPANRRGMAGGDPDLCPNPAAAEIALRSFVEQFEEGLAVVDKGGRALFINNAAAKFLDGTHLRLVDGYLRAHSPVDSMALRRMLAECVDRTGGSSIRLVFDDDTLLIAASAIRSKGPASVEPTVLLRLIKPETALMPSEDALRAQFGFTLTEAALALALLAGNDLAACATARGITMNTARAHLRSMFDKTGTCRQASLIRLLLLCPRTIMGQAA